MPDEFAVHISRRDLHAIEIPGSFETDGSFDVELVNHGTALHAHLHLDDALSTVATLDANNHYVEGGDERVVRITVDADSIPDDGLFGRLKIVSAYGSETRWVDIELTQPTPATGSVRVDESLSTPSEPRPNRTRTAALDGAELPILALGGLALLVAALAAVFVRNVLVTVGAVVVIGGAAVVLAVLRRG